MSEKPKILYVSYGPNESRVVMFPETNRVIVEVLNKDSLGYEAWSVVVGGSDKVNILAKALWKQVMDDGN